MRNEHSPKPKKVLAIGLDAPNQDLLLRWITDGHLPNLQMIRNRSSQVNLKSVKRFSNEHCWIPLLTGQSRDKWPHWLDSWCAENYQFDEASIFDWLQAPVFYALGDSCQVISFDLTAPVVEGVNGIQVSGWATELNECYPDSSPPELFQTLLSRYGPDPKLTGSLEVTNRLSSSKGVSHTVPCLYQPEQIQRFIESQLQSIDRRTRACIDLIRQESWDLFITLYSETHTAGHILWHLSQPHPLNELRQDLNDPLLQIYQAMDQSIGEILKVVDDHVQVVIYTIDEMVPDSLENARAALLPEFLYRWNFPGKSALAEGECDAAPPSPRIDYSRHWKHEVWNLRTQWGNAELESPSEQESRGDPMSWCPASWYKPLWPRMKAIALPSVADGYIRINVTGREANGVVDESEFQSVCTRLIDDITGVVNARTGKSIVREVIRVRESPFDNDPKSPPADLIVVFYEDGPLDTVDSTLVGRIGPVPYFRTGSHQSHDSVLENLMFIAAPDVTPGKKQETGQLEDIPATLLAMLDMEQPSDFDGISRL